MTVAMRRDDIMLRGELGVVATVSPRVRLRVLDEASGVRHFDRRWILVLAAALLLGSIGIPLLAGGVPAESSSPVQTSEPTVPAASVAQVSPPGSASPSPLGAESPSPSASPSPGAGPFVTGGYVYGATIKRRDSIAAHFEGTAVGEWSRAIPATGEGDVYGGSITCLVIEGKDAWMAGVVTTATDDKKGRAVSIHVYDGGPDGAGDAAFLLIGSEAQTLTTMEEWCRRKFSPADPYPLVSGDIVVNDGAPTAP